MKSILITIAAGATSALVGAQDFGQVVSSTPVMGQVAIPQQTCQIESVVLPDRRSGAGAAIGAVAGAAVGNTIGHGGGRAVSTLIGMVGGAAIGDRIEGGDAHQLQQVRRCTTYTTFENRVMYYDVVYAYAGRQYSARMPHDPGTTVQLQIAPVAMHPVAPASPVNPATPFADTPTATMAPSETTIYSSVEYVPYRAPVRLAPILVVPGTTFIGHGQRGPAYTGHRHRHPHRTAQPYPRHQRRDASPHWR